MQKQITLFVVFLLSLNFLSAQEKLAVGSDVPSINITNWIANTPSDKNLKEKILVIDFWATWCGPCIKAVPHFNELNNHFSDRDDIVFISMSDETPRKINPTLKRIGFESVVASDTSRKTHKALGIPGLPETFIIDKASKLVWRGHPEALSIQMIDNVLANRPIENASLEETTSEESPVIEEQGISFQTVSKMFKDDQVIKTFQFVETSQDGAMAMSKLPAFLYNSSTSIPNLFGKLLDVPSTRIICPEEISKNKYALFYMDKESKSKKKTKLAIQNRILDTLSLKLEAVKKKVKTWEVSVVDESKLVPATSENTSISHAGDKIIYTKVSIQRLLEELEGQFDLPLSDQSKLKGLYDFIIEIENKEVLAESLRSYGLDYETGEKNMNFYELKLR